MVFDEHPPNITTTVSAGGLVYTNRSRRFLWARSSEGWTSGRCTLALRFLTDVPAILPGFRGPLDDGWSTDRLGDVLAVLAQPASTLFTDAGARGTWSAVSDPFVAGTTIWLQLDVDTGEVRLKVNSRDFGLVHTLPPGFPRPVHPVIQHFPFRASLMLLPSPPQ